MWKNGTISHPEDGGQLDGLHWLMLDETAKYAFVCGFVEGLFQGHCFTTWGWPGMQSDKNYRANAVRSFDHYWDKFVGKQTYGDVVTYLDKFYAEEQNCKNRNSPRIVGRDEHFERGFRRGIANDD